MAQEKIKYDDIPTYSQVAFNGSWAARGRAIWAVAALGLVFGAGIGLVAPFFPVAAGQGVSAALGMVPSSVAIFSALGMTSGFAVGSLVGASAGAVSAVGKEFERRQRERELELGLPLPKNVTQQAQEPPAKQSWRDLFDTYINPRVGALFAVIGAIGGLVMAAGYLSLGAEASSMAMPAMKTLLGEAAMQNAGMVTAYFTGLMASFGALWSFNFPKMATELQHFTGRVMSGELLGRKWEPQRAKEPEKEIAKIPPAPAAATLTVEFSTKEPGYALIAEEKRFSLKRLMAREENGAAQEMSWTR